MILYKNKLKRYLSKKNREVKSKLILFWNPYVETFC